MLKAAVMLVAVAYGGGPDKTFTIPGYASVEECKASQVSVAQQVMTEPFQGPSGTAGTKRSLPANVRTKCVSL